MRKLWDAAGGVGNVNACTIVGGRARSRRPENFIVVNAKAMKEGFEVK